MRSTRHLLFMLAIAATLALPPKANARSMNDFTMIGISTAFLMQLAESDTCRSLNERFEAAGVAGFGILAGALGGTLLETANGGRPLIGNSASGSRFGAFIGESLGNAGTGLLANSIADIVVKARQSPFESFAMNACLIIKASDVIREPLVKQYKYLLKTECGQTDVAEPTAELADDDLLCLNNSHATAREITLNLIRLNQSTCAAIKNMDLDVTRRFANRIVPPRNQSEHQSSRALGPNDCDNSRPEEVWQHFIQGRY